MVTESELEINCKVAAAKLAVAEELRMLIGALAGFLVHAYWGSWLVSAGVGLACLYVVPYWYGKEYDAAWDAYEKATGTGKYYAPTQESDSA